MRIALTGASGLIGRAFHARLIAEGHEVARLGRRDADLHFDLSAPPPPLAGFDWLIHAGFAHIPGKYRGGEGDDPDGFRRLNLDGSCALFERAAMDGVGHVTFLSSRAVYDGISAGPLREEMARAPTSLYGQIKLEAERALAALPIPATSLRATGVYAPGPGHKWESLFADVRAGRPIPPRMGSELHADDLLEAAKIAKDQGLACANASDLMLDRHDLIAAYTEAYGLTAMPPPRAQERPAEMDCTRLAQAGWRPGGWEKLRAALHQMN